MISLQENNIAGEKRVTADKDSGGSIEIMTVEKNKNYTSAENVNENIIIPLGVAIYYSKIARSTIDIVCVYEK